MNIMSTTNTTMNTNLTYENIKAYPNWPGKNIGEILKITSPEKLIGEWEHQSKKPFIPSEKCIAEINFWLSCLEQYVHINILRDGIKKKNLNFSVLITANPEEIPVYKTYSEMPEDVALSLKFYTENMKNVNRLKKVSVGVSDEQKYMIALEELLPQICKNWMGKLKVKQSPFYVFVRI